MELEDLSSFKEALAVKRELVRSVSRDVFAAHPITKGALDRAFAITACFEGRGYSQTTGDFDTQGLSWGFLQWCLGQGSLQPVLLEIYTVIPDQMRDCLREICDDVLRVCKGTLPWKALAMKINRAYSKYKLKDPYQAYFERLGSLPKAQEIQRHRAQNIAYKAANYCVQYRWGSERAFCLAFDIVVQNGSIGATKWGDAPAYYKANVTKGMEEYQKLEVMATAISKKCNPKYAEDVLSRKMCIAKGHGRVHGGEHDLARDFGLATETWCSDPESMPKDKDVEPEQPSEKESQQS